MEGFNSITNAMAEGKIGKLWDVVNIKNIFNFS